jgi:uncharacterized membrane protein YfcA
VCVGTITGLFSAGGGLIIVPSLNALLRVSMTTAIGAGAAHVPGGSRIALWRQLDRRFLGIRVAAVAAGIPLGTRFGLAAVERLKHVGTIGVLSREVVAADFVLQAAFFRWVTAASVTVWTGRSIASSPRRSRAMMERSRLCV